jgi:hypothetical protein
MLHNQNQFFPDVAAFFLGLVVPPFLLVVAPSVLAIFLFDFAAAAAFPFLVQVVSAIGLSIGRLSTTNWGSGNGPCGWDNMLAWDAYSNRSKCSITVYLQTAIN